MENIKEKVSDGQGVPIKLDQHSIPPPLGVTLKCLLEQRFQRTVLSKYRR